MFRENPNKKLSLAERGAIVALTNSGLGVREIARQLGISPATVGRWQFRFLETGDILRRENRADQELPLHSKICDCYVWF